MHSSAQHVLVRLLTRAPSVSTSTRWLSAKQAAHLTKFMPEEVPGCRIAAVCAMFSRIVRVCVLVALLCGPVHARSRGPRSLSQIDLDKFHEVMSVLNVRDQLIVSDRLGWLNMYVACWLCAATRTPVLKPPTATTQHTAFRRCGQTTASS